MSGEKSTERSITVDVGLTEARAIDSFVTRGDWSSLAPQDRARAYVQVCAQHGLNALSQPFAFLRLNGKEVLYATRGATDQLAAKHGITREIIDGPKIIDIAGTKVALCTARATLPTGRSETGTATLPVADPVNLYMKLETKAKRRATIALLGLAMLDETELATIPDRAQGDAPQPSREDLERAVVEVQQPKALPSQTSRDHEEQLSEPRDVVADLTNQAQRTATLAALAALWVSAKADVAALDDRGAQERAWRAFKTRAQALGATVRALQAEIAKQSGQTPPDGPQGPNGGRKPTGTGEAASATGTGTEGTAANDSGPVNAVRMVSDAAQAIIDAHRKNLWAFRNALRKHREELLPSDVPELARVLADLDRDPVKGWPLTEEAARQDVCKRTGLVYRSAA